MSNAGFTLEEARSLVAIAEEAPIPGGARMAVARGQLYQRFLAFYESATTAPESESPEPESPKPRKRKVPESIADAEDLTK